MQAEPESVLTMATIAGALGGAGRIIMALHGGERKPVALLIEAGLGAILGTGVAALLLYYNTTLQGPGWPYIIVGGFAGLAGAMGTRGLDIAISALKKRLGE
jgi:hypothetical protein